MGDFQQNRLSKDTIEVGKSYPITVAHITAKGIIVNIDGTDMTSFIHISKIANAFVDNIGDYVAVGEQYNAIGVSTDNGKDLSLQHLNLKKKVPEADSQHQIQTPRKEYQHFKSLDDMIEQANASYRDKHGSHSDNTKGKRRKPYKKPIYD